MLFKKANLKGRIVKNFLLFLSLFLTAFAPGFAQEQGVKICEQDSSAPSLEIFYDDNATNAQIDAGLDQILDFWRQNPHRVNDEFGENCDRLFTPFIFNAKMYNTGEIDFWRIEKALKFKPELNYEAAFFSPVGAAFLLLLPPSPAQKSKFSEADVIRLFKLLVAHGADANDKPVLSYVYAADGFELFKQLLDVGADVSEIPWQIALDLRSFAYENGVILNPGEAANPKAVKFGKSAEFREFCHKKIRYLKEFLKTKSLKEAQAGGVRFFIETNLAFDNAEAVEFLLKNGLCERSDECEFLRKRLNFTERRRF